MRLRPAAPRWFGKDRFSPACQDIERCRTPYGEPCAWCDEPIEPDDVGFMVPHVGLTVAERPWHRECFLRSIFGGLGHLMGACSCYGGARKPDPAGYTKRVAARLACAFHDSGMVRSPAKGNAPTD